jgi:hypothetical protein
MKRILLSLSLLLPICALAQTENATLTRVGDEMKVNADVQLTPKMLKGVKTFVLTPQITDGENTVKLSPIGLLSKNKFYPYLNAYGFDNKPGEMTYTKEDLPKTINIATSVPYQKWMDGARLEIVHEYDGCCGDSGVEDIDTVACYKEPCINFAPAFRDMDPEKMKKTEVLSGIATIEFPVNSSKLIKTFKNNADELDKITKSIGQVKEAKDNNIQSIQITGYASPEGKFANNERLAKERAQAVYDYVVAQYDFPEGLIQSQSIAENWEGLRKFIVNSYLDNKSAILDIIDSDLDSSAKEQKIRSEYKSDWDNIRKYCFPSLRYTSYAIQYKTKDYDASETKVDLAYSAMKDGDLEKAAEFLATAGNDPEAEYARGTLAGMVHDWPSASLHFKKALDGGLEEARPYYEEVSRYKYMRDDGQCCK